MDLIRHHTKKTRGRPSKPRKPSNILLLQLRDHTASVVAILRTISTISSHPDQCTTSRGISDQMLDKEQLRCCCTCLCHLYLYLSLPYMLVLCTCLYHLDLYCAICFCSADPLLSLSVPQSHMAGTNYYTTSLPYWRSASICKKPNCKTTRHCFSSQFILMQFFCWNM